MSKKLITAKRNYIKQKGNKTEIHCTVKEGSIEAVLEYNPMTGQNDLISKFVAKENINELFLFLDRSPADQKYIDSLINSAMSELITDSRELL